MKGTPVLIALILLLGVAFSLPSTTRANTPNSSTAPTIDGVAVRGCSHFTNSCSVLFNTTRSNDIVVVYTFETLDLQTSCNFVVMDSAGLSWTMRATVSGRNDGSTSNNRDQIAEFWARTATPLSADNVTESIQGCASIQYGGEYNGLTVFGISGANYANPFDPNGSLPASVSGYRGTPAALISTSNPSDMIIGVALQSTYGTLSPGPGFNPIDINNLGGGYSVEEYATISSPVTNFPVTFTDGANWYWEVIADAVQVSNVAPAADFNLTTSSGSLTVTAGSSQQSTINVTSVNNFNATVALRATVVPSGPGLSLSTSSVPVSPGRSGISVLTVSTTNATAQGAYNVTVTGTSGAISHSSTITVKVVSNAPGSFRIDGLATAGCNHFTNSCSLTFSTPHASDLIIVYTMEGLDLQTVCTFSVNDTAGLHWTLRGSVSGRNDGYTGSNRDQIAEFWAPSPSVLSSDLITESISGCASVQYGGEYNSLLVVAVAGANLNSPFDPNSSLPGSANGDSNTPSTTISTSNSHDLIISAAQQSSYGTLTPGPGFTQIFSAGPGGSAIEYQIVNSPQANLPVTYVDDTVWYWEVIADAVQAGITTPDFALSSSPSRLTITSRSSDTSNVNVTSVLNFAGTVNLQATIAPAGPVVTLSPSSVTVPSGGSRRSVLTVTTTNATALGSYKVTVTGTSATNSHSATIVVLVVSSTPGPLAIDSSASAGCGHNTNSCSATLSTFHLSDLIIVYAMEGLDLQTVCNFSVNDTAGLHWIFRGGVSGRNDGYTYSNRDQIAEFWAVSPDRLSSDTITESISGCASIEYGGEYNSLLVVAVAGADLGSPFDPNVSLPASASGESNTPSVTLSTSKSQDLIISAAQQSSFGTLTAGPGFTQIFSSGPGGSAEEYRIVNSPQTSLPVTYGDNASWYWEIMGDAVQAAPNFSISASAGNITIDQGSGGTLTINVTSLNGFAGTILLSVSISPLGPTGVINLSNMTLQGGGTADSVLTVSTTASTPQGSYVATVTATSGSITHTIAIGVRIVDPPGSGSGGGGKAIPT